MFDFFPSKRGCLFCKQQQKGKVVESTDRSFMQLNIFQNPSYDTTRLRLVCGYEPLEKEIHSFPLVSTRIGTSFPEEEKKWGKVNPPIPLRDSSSLILSLH